MVFLFITALLYLRLSLYSAINVSISIAPGQGFDPIMRQNGYACGYVNMFQCVSRVTFPYPEPTNLENSWESMLPLGRD